MPVRWKTPGYNAIKVGGRGWDQGQRKTSRPDTHIHIKFGQISHEGQIGLVLCHLTPLWLKMNESVIKDIKFRLYVK